MRCPEIELQAYVDGGLSPERAAFLEHHLTDCGDCRAELARLQAVTEALESWPLVAEPAALTARVMAQVRPRPTLPRFQLRWSDLALSLAGAGSVLAAMLGWRYLSSTDLARLWGPQAHLRLEMLRLKVLLWVRHQSLTSAMPWGLMFAGFALVSILALAAWGLSVSYPVTGGARSAHS